MPEQSYWWVKEAYGFFDSDEEGYPDAGQVIRQYREQRGLRPADLAHELGITDVAVRVMENRKVGLDSVALRRRLARLLSIPPLLLGLDSLHPRTQEHATWWVGEGYPAFTMGADGYPEPGEVIKYYRNRKKRHDHAWTQAGLGSALNLSAIAVRGMENNNDALDSIARRRALAFLLEIPPALLGLDSLHYLPEIGEQQLMKDGVALDYLNSIRPCARALPLYWEGYYASTMLDPLQEISAAIRDLRALLYDLSGNERREGLDLLCRYYQLGATIARDQRNYGMAFFYANRAVKLARSIGDNDLIASALLRRGFVSFEQNNIEAAVADLEAAYPAALHARASLKGLVLQVHGHYHAHLASSNGDRMKALRLMDEAGSIARSGPFARDDNYVRFGEGWYHVEFAETFIALNHPQKALDELALAIDSSVMQQPRRRAHIDIFRAKAYILKQEFAEATAIALNALEISRAIHSNIQLARILDLYTQLKASPYGSNPAVAKLGLMLRTRS